jgi:hypothetical protein
MPPLEILSATHSVHLLGHTLTLGLTGVASAPGWILFAIGALLVVRERMNGATPRRLPPLVSAGGTLAALSAGLGLLLGESYPTFARVFCFPYALLALAVAILGRALQAGGRPIGEE